MCFIEVIGFPIFWSDCSFVSARVLDSVSECDIFRVTIMFRISFVKREVKMLFFPLYTQSVPFIFYFCDILILAVNTVLSHGRQLCLVI